VERLPETRNEKRETRNKEQVMSKRIRQINDKPMEGIWNRTRNGFQNDLIADSNDSALFEAIGDYMKGQMDIEDVKNDPALKDTKKAVKKMISDYKKKISVNKENEKFIREIFSGEGSETRLTDEIEFIKQEIDNNKLNDITAEWVKEWHEQKQNIGVSDPKTKEISDFITGAINSTANEPVNTMNDVNEKRSGRSLFARYATLSAAALIGAFILIRTLLPSSDPDKLFNSYYKPFNAVSPVSRSLNSNETDNYYSAIESYKNGQYESAVTGFTSVVEKDASVVSPKFFLGLSQLALGNYDRAINLLSGVVNVSVEYGKEARWYLGLAYLKTADKQKAAECFEYLSRSDGFYRERSEKILRRLK
jgi:TolA-binding protein